jgi:hypothetical protein
VSGWLIDDVASGGTAPKTIPAARRFPREALPS